VRVRQRVAGHGRPGVRDVTAVARVIALHDPVLLERGLEGGGGVCALHLDVISATSSGRSLKTASKVHCRSSVCRAFCTGAFSVTSLKPCDLPKWPEWRLCSHPANET
jgi:hypothetical protein